MNLFARIDRWIKEKVHSLDSGEARREPKSAGEQGPIIVTVTWEENTFPTNQPIFYSPPLSLAAPTPSPKSQKPKS